ncbi:hypothetical protein [Streptomyces sp. H39-S7]|uniref:hypothetical protein n=1 Tax=Streptomyces sp. H39-S7 TaxID=3004357 RepID=UPI0022AEEA29|nr:hypothetical protein [Streptomyces sp. H39-S7]MCZ4119061.1 hypothetical protein [Streptomyces sp. H39-S7]
MPVKTVVPTTEPAISDDTLSDLVAAIKGDPTAVVSGVKARVAASQSDANNCMMGGWTA